TRDKRHAQYRVRCDGASCQAIHFNFADLAGLTEPGRHDVALALSKNEYNGAVSAQVQVRSLHRLEPAKPDLCATACDLRCHDRLSGEALWAALLAGGAGSQADGEAPPAADADGDSAADALRAARAAGRLVDRRRRPAVSQLAALLSGGEPVLVLAADVARRRPLLTRDVLAPGLDCSGAYVQAACRHRLAAQNGAGVVLASPDLALDAPSFARSFEHVVLLDPPFTGAMWAGLAAAAPEAYLHALWGADEAAFAGRVRESQFDLDAAMRRVWKALAAGSGRFDDALEQELLDGGAVLAPVAAVAAALEALRETGLLIAEDDGGYHLERPQSKVDVTRTDACRRWHHRYQTPDFLQTCLTAQL
ncbi:MAG TPA: hypothetical protein VIK03_08825, partial [Thermoleophilia bacterium]